MDVDALEAGIQHCFTTAIRQPNIRSEDADILQSIAADVADCSAREVITFLLPALDRHAGGVPSLRPWNCVDSALLRALLIALRHVRPKQQPGMLTACLRALLLQISPALHSSREPEPAEESAGVRDILQSTGSAPGAGSSPSDQSSALDEPHPEPAGLPRDVAAFVRGALAALAGEAAPTAPGGGTCGLHPAAEQLTAFVLSVLATAVTATASSDSASPGAAVPGNDTYVEQQQSSVADPFTQLYVLREARALAVALLGCLPCLGVSGTQQMGQHRESLVSAGTGLEMGDSAAAVRLGLAAVVHAAWVPRPARQMELPANPEERLTQLLETMKVFLALASEHRSVRLSLAALQMVSATSQRQLDMAGQLASAAVLPALLPAAQDLVMTMVQHPAPRVRAAACRSLQHLIRSLDPGFQLEVIHELLGCPYPSVAAILLQQLKQLIADTWPPAPEALALAAEYLQVSGDVNAIVETAEPTCCALNIFRYVLLREPRSETVVVQLAPLHIWKRVQDILLDCQSAVGSLQGETIDVNAIRALERVCEVATRVLDLASQ